MIQMYRCMRVIVVSWWQWVTEHKESWSWNLQVSPLYIQLQISRFGLVKGQPCLTDVSHSWKKILCMLVSPPHKLSSWVWGRSRQEGRGAGLQAGLINKALSWCAGGPATHPAAGLAPQVLSNIAFSRSPSTYSLYTHTHADKYRNEDIAQTAY